MQLLNDPVVRAATIAGVGTYLLACVVSAVGESRTGNRERADQLPLDFPRGPRNQLSDHSRTLLDSFGQGAMNLALAVVCCVMALSESVGTVGTWLPRIFTDRQGTLNSLAEQLSNGSLILQLTTVAVGVTVLMRHIGMLRTLFGHEGTTLELWRRLRQLNITNAQGGVFLAALTIMWLLRGHGLDGLWMTGLAYVFAFFIDDWIIISEYSIRLDVPSLTFHKWRLRLAYVCLLIPSVVLAWYAFGGWGVAVTVWYALALWSVAGSHRKEFRGRRPSTPLPGQRRQEDPEATRPRSRPSS